jgi:DNA-binding MarR family transcriptional regulator
MHKDYASDIINDLRRMLRSVTVQNKEIGARYDLTVPQVECLRQLFLNAPTNIGQLADLVGLSQPALTGILDRLEGKDLVRRERSERDRRIILVSLTDRGQRLVCGMPGRINDRLNRRLADLPEHERRAMENALKRLRTMMEEENASQASARHRSQAARSAGLTEDH